MTYDNEDTVVYSDTAKLIQVTKKPETKAYVNS